MKLEIKGVSFSYGSRPALDDVTVSIGEGEIVALVGPNGSGKTTLIKCINRILKPRKGVVLVDGRDAERIKRRDLARLLSYVPQSAAYVFPSTVFDTVLLGRRPYVNWGISPRDKEVVYRVLSLMGLESFASRDFNELSGGERQKVLIARALAQEPQVLLLDEPTSNLDLRHQLEVLNILRSVVKGKGMAAIMAMHDLNLAARFSDRMIFLREGKIWDVAEPEEAITSENIRVVYGVEAVISKDLGHPHIVPIKPAVRYPDRMRSHHQALAPLFAFLRREGDFAGHLLSLTPDARKRTVYIHVPFCTRKCTFCNLFRFEKPPPPDYHRLIIRELETYASYPYVREGTYHAVYFGGGTPTTLSAEALRQILQALRSNLNISPEAEITIETTVTDLTEDKLAVFQEEGVNRFSIGVQTFSDRGRRILGRKGSGRKAAEKLRMVRQMGFQNVGLDLIYNWPSQTEEELEDDLDLIESLDLAGFSFYSLILLKDTALSRMIASGKCEPLGDLRRERSHFDLIVERASESGFRLLGLTKLVRPGRDNYEYVRIRYENGDTLGLGAGAGGRLGNLVYRNPTSLEEYRLQVESPPGLPRKARMANSQYDFAHRVVGKLQYGRLDWADLAPFTEVRGPLRELAGRLAAEGLVQFDSSGFSLTREGVFWGNNIGREFALTLVRSLKGK